MLLSRYIYARESRKLRQIDDFLKKQTKIKAWLMVTDLIGGKMSANKYPEAHKLILFVEKVPFSAEEKSRLIQLLQTDGMTDENTSAVHQALAALPKETFKDDWQHAKFMMDLATILKQWQLVAGSKNFKHSR